MGMHQGTTIRCPDVRRMADDYGALVKEAWEAEFDRVHMEWERERLLSMGYGHAAVDIRGQGGKWPRAPAQPRYRFPSDGLRGNSKWRSGIEIHHTIMQARGPN